MVIMDRKQFGFLVYIIDGSRINAADGYGEGSCLDSFRVSESLMVRR